MLTKYKIPIIGIIISAIVISTFILTRPTYQQISQEQAQNMMNDTVIVLDVRTEAEYAEKHIPNAICIPNESIDTRTDLNTLLPNKNQTILVYCRSGNRSKQAAQKLANIGYTNVYEFGGINDWNGKTVSE